MTRKMVWQMALVFAVAILVSACTEPELPELGPPVDGGSLSPTPAPSPH